MLGFGKVFQHRTLRCPVFLRLCFGHMCRAEDCAGNVTIFRYYPENGEEG